MPLYYVARPNPFFKVGSFVEEDRSGMLQEKHVNGGYMGMMFPLDPVRQFLVRLQKNGIDKHAGGALG